MKLTELRKPKTDIDWAKYELHVTKNDAVLIHDLKKPDTAHGRIQFINICGIMAVTGDYGNWIFCREFHPSKDNYVSQRYWLEKLQIASCQKPVNYDADETTKIINERLSKEDLEEDEREWLEDCLGHVYEGEFWYTSWMIDNKPKWMDNEGLPIGEKINPWLEVIFDGFNEICRRMSDVKNDVTILQKEGEG